MKVSIAGVATDTLTEQNRSILGFLCNIRATTIANVTIANMENMSITATLYRGGNSTTLFSGNFWALGIYNNPSSMEGVVCLTSKAFRVALPGPLVLTNDDRLQVTVQIGQAQAGQVVTVSTEYGTGKEIEYFTPKIGVYAIPKTRTNEQVQAGNNVVAAAFVHTGTAYVINQVNIQSKDLQQEFGETELETLIAEQWEVNPSYASALVYAGDPIDNVNFNLNINTGAAGNGYFVWGYGDTNPTVLRRANEQVKTVAEDTAQKFTPVTK